VIRKNNIFCGRVELRQGLFHGITFDDIDLGGFRTLHAATQAVKLLAKLKDDEPLA
jgi:hypothetical protein